MYMYMYIVLLQVHEHINTANRAYLKYTHKWSQQAFTDEVGFLYHCGNPE